MYGCAVLGNALTSACYQQCFITLNKGKKKLLLFGVQLHAFFIRNTPTRNIDLHRPKRQETFWAIL